MANRKNIRGLGTLEQRGNVWHVDFCVNGARYRESTHQEGYGKAVAFLKNRISEIETGKFAGTSVNQVFMKELLEDVLEDYRLHHPKSLKCFASPVINRHLIPWFGDRKAAVITTSHIKTYIKERREEGAEFATINRDLAMLRRAFNLARACSPPKVGLVPSFKGLLFKENNARQGFFEHEEYVRFRDAMPADERAVFMFGYWTVSRWSEVLKLTWDRVDFAQRVAWLMDTKNGENRATPIGAPGRELYDLLAARLALRNELCPQCPWVFFRSENRGDGRGKAGAQIGNPVRQIREQWAAAVAATGIQRKFHDLRRTGARNLRKAKVSESVIMAIGGWKTNAVFRRYDIKDQADLHDASAAMGKLLGGGKLPQSATGGKEQ